MRKRITDIVLTALAGALIAFLQSLLVQLGGLGLPDANPEVAAGASGVIRLMALAKNAHQTL